jgi:hypothetical protein
MTDDFLWMTSAELVERYRVGDVSPLESLHVPVDGGHTPVF